MRRGGRALRGAAAAYLAVDRLDEALTPRVSALARLPRAVVGAAPPLLHGNVAGAASALLADDPALVDLAAGELSGATHMPLRVDALLVGGLYADGHPVLRSLGADPAADAAGPPRSLADLIGELARRDAGRSGEIDVRVLGGGAGPRKVVVDIPGTKDWTALARHNPDVTSPATNLRALAGESTTYERGVLDALRQAGVRPDDDVLLVGHSQGGMVAVNAAMHAAGSFHISHVITAGAPIGTLAGRVPRGVQVLALENAADPIPHLDGAENPDRVNVVTATVHHRQARLLDNHDIERSYLPGARDVGASDDPSLRAYLAGLSGFLTAREVHTTVYRISRGY